VSVNLPDGWRNLPVSKLQELKETLERLDEEKSSGLVPWLCTIPNCDGKPHKGRPGPHSRAEQRAPADPDWDAWLLLAGRGFGKTRTGAEWVIQMAKDNPGSRGALVGPTAADTRDILVEGESGILGCAKSSFRPIYEPSKRRVTYPNGSIQTLYSADEPDRLRGPQHHYAWFDELAAWRRLQATWDMAQFGLRLGDHPRVCITTTPRPLPLIKQLVKDDKTRVVRGSTYDNLHNLAPTFRSMVVDRYEGTTLGRQELHADILEDLPGALVARAHIDATRVDEAPELDLVIVAMDPAGTGTGDETGLVAVGRGAADGHAYVLADHSQRLSAQAAADRAWWMYGEYGAEYLVYEDNYGKQWLTDGLKDAYRRKGGDREFAPLRSVTAQHGKKLRAQPVAMRYEQNKVHHVGSLPELEDQLTTWIPEESPDSPDRIDALVHGVTDLLKRERSVARIVSPHAAGLGRARGAAVHPLMKGRRTG